MPLLSAIEELGFEQCTPIQELAIPVVMTGVDVIGQAQTGTGKTAAFGIPAIENTNENNKQTQVLIICPTRELALQVKEQIESLAKFKKGILVTAIYGGESYDRQFRNLKKGTQIVVGTPGRIKDHIDRGTLKLDHLKMCILDEADEMLNMGFREDMEEILSFAPEERQTVLFSATMSKDILNIAKKFQKKPEIIKVTKEEMTNENITQNYFSVRREGKLELMCRLIDKHELKLMLVFCNTKNMVDQVASDLQAKGYAAEAIHGDMRQAARNQVMTKFKSGNSTILVATDVAARGIDVNNVDAVFNYDVPLDLEYYVHRIGRTGRAGKEGLAFSFVSGSRDRGKLKELERYTKVKIEEGKIPTAKELASIRKTRFVERVISNISEENTNLHMDLLNELADKNYGANEVIASLIKMQLGELDLNPTEIDLADKAGRDRESNGRGRGRDRQRDRKGDKPTYSGSRRGARESGMTRLFINLGKMDRISPSHIVGAIASESKVPGKVLGQIDIYDKFSFIDVPERDVQKVLDGMKGKTINARNAKLEIAN